MPSPKPTNGSRPKRPASYDPSINESLADAIQKETVFRLSRLPIKFVTRIEIVKLSLLFLWILLVISNNVGQLGLWRLFVQISTSYRDDFNGAVLDQTGFDFARISSWHLWKGWVVPSVLAGGAYIVTSLLCLRQELYHWKPELLARYFQIVSKSRLGPWIPQVWLDMVFQVYEDKHRDYVYNHIQQREHVALQDSREFLKVLRVVGFNILLAVVALLAMWIVLLQTNIDATDVLHLPPSHVPPVQGLVWYMINDALYFYPHWIAHMGPASNAHFYWVLPGWLARKLHTHFKDSHRLHHRTKANLGIAAWYCSPAEQLLFNLFPALVGPVLTQILADALGVEKIWGTHLVVLYAWLTAASASSVLAHTGYRSTWNDPGKHDLHHARAFDPKAAVNFGTLGLFDWIHGTASSIPKEETRAWRGQRDRQAALVEASRRSGIPLTRSQRHCVQQPVVELEWTDVKDEVISREEKSQ